jgi:hypothetical protein
VNNADYAAILAALNVIQTVALAYIAAKWHKVANGHAS